MSALKLTVDTDLSDKANIFPAGTVKLFILTVVHSTASETSSNEEIVPTHGELAAVESLRTDKTDMSNRKFILVLWWTMPPFC